MTVTTIDTAGHAFQIAPNPGTDYSLKITSADGKINMVKQFGKFL